MIVRYFKFYYLVVLGIFLNTMFLFLQKKIVAKHEHYGNMKECTDIPYQILKDEHNFFDRLATYFAEHEIHKGQDTPAPLLRLFCR